MSTTDVSTTSRGGRRRAGFTLIELLVAVVLSGILATVIFQLINAQGQFVSRQSAREEVQQNSRAALELITSELRALPPGGITTAATDQIAFRLPRVWGILCNPVGTAGGIADVVFAPGTFPDDYPMGTLDGDGPNLWGLAIPEGTTTDEYVAASLTSTTATDGTCPAGVNVRITDGVAVRNFSYSALSKATAGSVGPTSRVFLFQTVRYTSGTSNLPGVWLRRTTGSGSAQPMAGPLSAPDGATSSPGGLVFAYQCRIAGTRDYRDLTDTERSLADNLLRIERVKVKLSMQSRNRVGSGTGAGGREEQADSMIVHLRNRQGATVCP